MSGNTAVTFNSLHSSSNEHQDSLFLDTPVVKLQNTVLKKNAIGRSIPLDILNNNKQVI